MIKCNPILIEKTRGSLIESFHRGAVCIVDKHQNIVFSIGDVSRIVYPRSALKFVQQILLIESGAAVHYGLTEPEIALACGSHNGEAIHLAAVRSMLHKAGLSEKDLRCGAHEPIGVRAQQELRLSLKEPTALHNNCSGKHAAFLVLTKFWNYPLEDYLNPEHPLQLKIKQVVGEFHECSPNLLPVGVDGCSAPIYGLSLYAQAVGTQKFCHPTQLSGARKKAVEKIFTAVTRYPEMVAGEGRYCTEVMRAAPGKILAKTGAEGVYCLGFKAQGLGCAIKLDDGATGLQYHVAQKILEESGLFKKDVFSKLSIIQTCEIRNWNGIVIGDLKINALVFKNLKNCFVA